jgi:tRNA-2-methylthio-N6-dimethylallyladenosine synthase
MPSVYIETYGCQMNVSDSELMYGKLAAEGYTTQDTPHGADVVLVNTCAIRENAEQRVIGGWVSSSDHQGGRRVGVTGCMAQRLGPRLLETDTRVQLVVGPDGIACSPR